MAFHKLAYEPQSHLFNVTSKTVSVSISVLQPRKSGGSGSKRV